MTEFKRKLASIKKIKEIKYIPEADKICAYRVDGWWVVDQIEKYTLNEMVLFFQIDSWIPHELAPFLSKGQNPREYNGVKGNRLRTIYLKKQLSQGLILPLDILPKGISPEEGVDYSKVLNVQKWEAPIPAQLGGIVKGNFPSWIPKTDEERIQNLYKEVFEDHINETYEITEKLDGTSMTVYVKNGEVGVCGRNWDLTEDDSNSLWASAKNIGIIDYFNGHPNLNIAIQGELIGQNINGNIYKLNCHKFYTYNIYDINLGEYWKPSRRRDFMIKTSMYFSELMHVPVVDSCYNIHKSGISGIDGLLEKADGFSEINPKVKREGIVFKSHNTGVHFKCISNKYLIKTGN